MTCTVLRLACRRAFSQSRFVALVWLLGLSPLPGADVDPATAPGAIATPATPVTATKTKLGDSYKIQPQDILIIDVVNEPLIGAKEFRVSAGGEISYPYIGSIKVVDQSPVDVQMELKRLLETDYLVSAQVIVQVKEYRKRLVQVMGQVNRPGPVEIPPERRLSVIEAISQANGFTRLARKNDIEVSRKGQKPVRCSDEEQRNNPDKTIYLEPDDVVYVPESRI